MRANARQRAVGSAIYVCLLCLVTAHFYLAPFWDLDMLGYMGNARLNDTIDPVKLHGLVYGELRASVPSSAFGYLTGAPGEPDQSGSKHDRFLNAYHYTEFLPCFAIRPLYNQIIYRLSRTGLGLVRSIRLVSALSYYLIGIIVLLWLGRYTPYSPVLSFLIMLLPPVSLLGRNTTADALSVLLGLSSLFVIFELDRVAIGIGLLSVAIWVRTDNVVLIVPVLAVLCFQRRLQLWVGAVFAVISVAAVLVINHAAGDYGIRMLYYRNFLGTPLAPGEMIAHFTGRVPVFLILSTVGLNRRTAPLLGVVTAYVMLHYVILPNWIDRWMGVFYVVTCMVAAMNIKQRQAITRQTGAPKPLTYETAVA